MIINNLHYSTFYITLDVMRWQTLQRTVFVLFLASVTFSLILYAIYGENLGLDNIRQYLSGLGIWAPLVFVLIYAACTIFLPSTPFTAIAGVLFGFKYGLIYALLGIMLSSVAAFVITKKMGKEKAEVFLKHKYLKLLDSYNKRLEEGPIWDVIIFRMTPVMPSNVLSILLGLSRIKFEDFVIGSFVGFIPTHVLTVYFGDFLSKIF